MADKSKNWWEKLLYGTGETHTIPQVTVPVTDEERLKSIEGGYMNPSITALDNAPKGTNLRALETANGNLVTRPADYTGIQGSATQAKWHDQLADFEKLPVRPADYTGIQGTPSKTSSLSDSTSDTVSPKTVSPKYVSYSGGNGYNGVSNPSQLAGVNQDVYDEITKPFEQSAAYKEITAYNDALLKQLTSGRTAYSDELDNLIAQYKNRGDFNYDPNSDMLYQNYLTSMQNAGQMAMKDTMGQAAALTGGYGSTYATAAANGAYNNYLQTANDNLVNFYNMALDKYNLEGEEALRGIDLTKLQDETEYERLANAYRANLDKANTMYSQEYNEWAGRLGQMQNVADAMRGDYWQNESNIMSTDQFNATQQYRYDALAQDWDKYTTDRKDALDQWNYKKEQDQISQALEKEVEAAAASATGFAKMSDKDRLAMFKEVAEAYRTGGRQYGEEVVAAYDATYDFSNEEKAQLAAIGLNAGDLDLSLKDNKDHLNNKKNVYVDENGKEYNYDDLLKLVEDGLITEAELKDALKTGSFSRFKKNNK